MRIGFDARLFHYQQAGISLYMLRLLRALVVLDRSIEFVVLQSRKDKAPLVREPNALCRSIWTPCHHRMEQLGLAAEMGLTHIDLLHSPDFIPLFFRRFRSVITVHDLAFLIHPEALTHDSLRYYRQINRAVRSANRIIAVSFSTRDDLVTLLDVPAEKIDVIHSAADEAFHLLDVALVEKYRRDAQLPLRFVLFVGTIEPRKNLPTLLHAFALLKSRMSDSGLCLVIAGSKGWLYEEVFDLIQTLGLRDAVRLVRPETTEELALLYNAATVFTLPSLYEGFGFTPLEAMSCGTPVIVSRSSALPEVVGEAGILVEPTGVEELAQALERLLDDETLRADLREKGLRRAAQFSWQKTAAETLTTYHKAVA